MTFQPAHKVTTSMNKPGQIVNPLMFPNQLKHEAEQVVKSKQSFELWWNSIGVWNYGNYIEKHQALDIWNAAQQNT